MEFTSVWLFGNEFICALLTGTITGIIDRIVIVRIVIAFSSILLLDARVFIITKMLTFALKITPSIVG
jgi:hypothetical protein